jgi:O-antigen/teichoic acid export membrane protein
MLPIYTQHLSPAEYGIIGLLAMVLGLYELFLGARFGAALPKFFYDSESISQKKSLISSALVVTSLASLVGALIFASSARYLASDFFERPDLTYAISLYGFMLISSAIEEYVLVLFRLREKPFYFFAASILKLIFQLSLNIYFLVELSMGVPGVIYGNIIASILLAIITGSYAIHFSGLRVDIKIAQSLVQFTWPIWLAGFAAIYIKLTTNFLIKYFISIEEVGIYHFAMKFSMLITLFLWRPYNQWWQTERFKISNNSAIPKLEFSSSFILISSLMMMGVVGISLFSEIVIDLMADSAFYRAREFVPILCFLALFQDMHLFISFPFYKTGKTGYFPKIKFGKAVLVTVTVAIGAFNWSLEGALYALLLCNITEFLVVHRIGQRQYDQGLPVTWFYLMVIITFIYLMAVLNVIGLEMAVVYRLLSYFAACLIYVSFIMIVLFFFGNKGKEVLLFIKREL